VSGDGNPSNTFHLTFGGNLIDSSESQQYRPEFVGENCDLRDADDRMFYVARCTSPFFLRRSP
jgi:hypothetical protein